MKVFLSWSGEKSKAAAVALHDWLPSVIQEVEPFMSESDIAAGARWLNEIDQQLEGTNFAIVCVTRQNQTASWLNFEAGAVAKVINTSRVVPLAIDLTVADVKPPPGHFQAKDISRPGIMAVLESLNEVAERPLPSLGAALEKWWPDLEPKLKAAASALAVSHPVRGERELLEEILASVRSLGERTAMRDSDRERFLDAEARAAVTAARADEFARDAEQARRAVASAEGELAARRRRDGDIADRVLEAVSRILPNGSRAVVLDDYANPRMVVQSPSQLSEDETLEIAKCAAQHLFEVEFGVLPPTAPPPPRADDAPGQGRAKSDAPRSP